MSPTVTIVLLWLGFAGSHLTLSSVRVRQALVARIGEGPFRGLYSLVAFAFFIPLVWTYFGHKHAGPWLWTLPLGPGLRWAIYAGMGLAFVLVVAGFIRPSPAAVTSPADGLPSAGDTGHGAPWPGRRGASGHGGHGQSQSRRLNHVYRKIVRASIVPSARG